MNIDLQYAVIVLAVLSSAGYVVHSRFSASLRRLRVATALPLLREGRAPWLQALGRRIAPLPSAIGDKACGGCDGCGSSGAQ